MFEGVIAPTVTLLERDGSIDIDENRRHADYLINSGVHGLYILGTTGEFMHFNLREREGFASAMVEHVRGRLPIIIGTASTSTRDQVRLCRHAQGIGASAVTVAAPYYWTLSNREVIGHFSTIATAVDIPILVYNVPDYSGIDISNETLITLAREHPNIAGIIDIVDSVERIRTRIDGCGVLGPDFSILTGSDGMVLNLLHLGGHGVIPPTSNLTPATHVGIVQAYRTGDLQAAIDLYRRLAKSLDIYGVPGSFHSVVKEAMVMLDLAEGATVRSPALPLTPESRAQLREVLTRAELMTAAGRE